MTVPSERRESFFDFFRTAVAGTAAVICLGLVMIACQSEVVPVTGYESAEVNDLATKLKSECVTILRSALQSGDPRTRMRAAIALSSVRDAEGIKNAGQMMGGRMKEAALRVAYFFVRNGMEPGLGAKSEADVSARRGRGSFRELGITVLGRTRDPQSIDMVRSMWRSHDDVEVRIAAGCALARRGDQDAIDWLRDNAYTWLDYEAFDACLFADIADDPALASAINAARVGAMPSARNAVLVAETTQDRRFLSVLPVLVARKTGSLRVMAATVLAEMENTETINVLKQAMDSRSVSFPDAAWAALGLARVGDESGLQRVLEYLNGEKSDAKRIAAACLILPGLDRPGHAVCDSFEYWVAVNH